MGLWNWILPSNKRAARADRRAEPRRRTRLRPGKLLAEDKTFLADCAIVDRSDTGMRVRVFGSPDRVAEAALIFDENEGAASLAKEAWRAPPDIGFRTGPTCEDLTDEDRRRLAGPYYAVTD